METDTNGYVKVSGSSDYEDSSHLAGLLAVTNHPQQVDCRLYVAETHYLDEHDFKYIRCPNSKYDFSRDQFTVLASGLIAQGCGHLVNLDYINGKDIMPFSVRGLVRIAQGKKPMCYSIAWLKAEIYWHSYLQPLDEPFQILAMILTYDNFNGNNELLKLWAKHNKLWRWSIRRYLCELDGAWRNEPELADYVIKYIESKLI